jgi:hypothetical protein
MAKSVKLEGPLYTPPGASLGGQEVSGKLETKSIPDPLGYNKSKGGK